MKKILIALTICTLVSPAKAFIETTSANDHNMMILRQQQFRFQEFDMDKDFQTQKQQKIKEDENYIKKINSRHQIKSFAQPKEFVEENGEIKIKGVE